MACCETNKSSIIEDVKEYYGKTLKNVNDLATPACKTPSQQLPKHVKEALTSVHEEVVSKYYGCGIVVPECLQDMNILDLGSGSGRDCYALAKLVGERGFVTGIDMTKEQVELANKYKDYHQKQLGFPKSNVKFVNGYIEKLLEAGIEQHSIDLIISNCVINLCKDKKEVLKEAFMVLKDGGELYFSDVYADRVLSDDVRSHKLLWGECVAGALCWTELGEIAKDVGFEAPRLVTCTSIALEKSDLKEVLGDAKFVSVVYRLFKLQKGSTRDQACQVSYKGSVSGHEEAIKFDRNLTFKKGDDITVDGTTAAILQQSRFKDHFIFSKPKCGAEPKEVTEVNPFDVQIIPPNEESRCCGGKSKCC